MNRAERVSLAAIPIILLIAAAIAWAGSQGGIEAYGMPVFALCGLAAFALNWLVFIFAYSFQTERYFDLTGSLTYATLVILALVLRDGLDLRSLLLGGLMVIWCARLGSFLFLRITQDGSDGRFDELKPSFPRFLMTWTLQGLWVFLTMACALAAMTSTETRPIGGIAVAGFLVWAAGFAIEVTADKQKRRFRADPAHRSRFIQSGLWAWSRHPNYFGEITLWIGIALVALPVLSGWQYATLISPIFVYVLLTRISGIPLLEARAKKKWGNEASYQAYKQRTPALLLRPPQSA